MHTRSKRYRRRDRARQRDAARRAKSKDITSHADRFVLMVAIGMRKRLAKSESSYKSPQPKFPTWPNFRAPNNRLLKRGHLRARV
jgi:hypothetical protein